MTSSSDLKDLIKTNFHDDVKSGDFDVGNMVGTEVIRVQAEEDLKEMWGEIRKNRCTTLWCDGLVDDESSKSSKSSKPGRKKSVQHLMRNQMMRQLQVSQQRHRKRRWIMKLKCRK